jgi:hypothetical protein
MRTLEVPPIDPSPPKAGAIARSGRSIQQPTIWNGLRTSGVGSESAFDEAVVALGLTQVDGERSQRLLGRDAQRVGGELGGRFVPGHLMVADAGRLEDGAARDGAEGSEGGALDAGRGSLRGTWAIVRLPR